MPKFQLLGGTGVLAESVQIRPAETLVLPVAEVSHLALMSHEPL